LYVPDVTAAPFRPQSAVPVPVPVPYSLRTYQVAPLVCHTRTQEGGGSVVEVCPEAGTQVKVSVMVPGFIWMVQVGFPLPDIGDTDADAELGPVASAAGVMTAGEVPPLMVLV